MDQTSQVARSYYNAFSGGDGAIVLEDLHRSYMDRISHNEDDPNPYDTAYREGQRSVVIAIKALMAMGMQSPE